MARTTNNDVIVSDSAGRRFMATHLLGDDTP
jgi:hypothetical protein